MIDQSAGLVFTLNHTGGTENECLQNRNTSVSVGEMNIFTLWLIQGAKYYHVRFVMNGSNVWWLFPHEPHVY